MKKSLACFVAIIASAIFISGCRGTKPVAVPGTGGEAAQKTFHQTVAEFLTQHHGVLYSASEIRVDGQETTPSYVFHPADRPVGTAPKKVAFHKI